jgi:Galactose oxidase-like, Early set domain
MKNLSNRRAPRRLPSMRRGGRRVALPLLLVGAAIGALTLHGCQDKNPTAAIDAGDLAPSLARTPAAPPIVNGTGKWAAPFAWGGTNPGVGIHLHVLPNGKVLTFGHSGTPAVWDPATGTFTSVPSPSLVFCSGHAWLPDGRLLIMGGHDDALGDEYGQRTSNIFDYATQTWQPQAPMAYGRWYPTSTTLPNGDILTTGGTDSVRGQMPYPEIRSGSTTRILTGAKYDFGQADMAYYPRMFVAPNGKVFYAGEEQQSRWLDVSGNGSWTNGPRSNFGRRDYGSAVEFAPGKILIMGGGYTPTATAETIDLTAASPTWTYTGSMASARRQLNATVLADGTVMVNGGTSITGFTEEAGAVFAAERWNPTTGTWSTMASQQVIRVYHSTAVLLPDGRVLSAGSGEGSNATAQLTAEIFSPPYLFDATGALAQRPQISSIPSSARYGQSFTVGYNKGANVGRVTLVRLSSVTHAFNESQLFLTLPFTVASKGNKITVTAPANGQLAPPGPYMLFLFGANGAPSVAKILRIG